MSDMQMSSAKCIAVKFLVVANAMNFFDNSRNKKNYKKENR